MISRKLELLAPAGDFDCLKAALDAGADAVYLGLESLNARRRARNFRPDEFASAVSAAHAKGARVYLTLNIDLAERELGDAARLLELARSCKADAVLVRDFALFALKPAFPELEFHLSTQACAANSADAAAAVQLGIRRAVLARELALDEIKACAAVPGLEVEVFVQGALCFSVSGRCWLSSWAGGRGGNRGACASPCRVPWTVGGEAVGTPLSMKDLSVWDRLEELEKAGVTALKIEGRLKNPDWVRRAVSLYRRALSGDISTALAGEAALGDVAGRDQTSAYLDGKRKDLTGVWGRKSGEGPATSIQSTESKTEYDFEITVGEKSLACRCAYAGREQNWTMPKTSVVRIAKAVALSDFLRRLSDEPVQGLALGQGQASEPDLLLPPRAINALRDRLSVELRLLRKDPQDNERVGLPPGVKIVLAKSAPSPENRLRLGDAPDRLRVEAAQLSLMRGKPPAGGAIVEGLTAQSIKSAADCGATIIAALPQVFFEADIPGLRALLQACLRLGVAVEVNNLGGWQLAREAGVAMEGGPGLAVLNSLAARQLQAMGLRSVTLSMEADKGRLEDISAVCPTPVSVVVFGRPPLMSTRVELRAQWQGQVFADRRGIRMRPRREGGLWVFRPEGAFDWRWLKNPAIRAKHLVMDLVGSDNPLADQESQPGPDAFLFNYKRTLY